MRLSRRVFLALGLGLLTGCVGIPVLNPVLQPVNAPDRWLKGAGYLKQVRGGVEVQAAFLEAGSGSLLFDVVVANRGASSVLVSPERFFCDLTLPEGSKAPREVPAVDPELMIQQLSQASATERASQANTSLLRGIFVLADLGDTLTQSTKRSPREQREVNRDRLETLQSLDESDQRSDSRMSGLADQRRHWEEDHLRKTTLDPGYGLRGKAVFHLKAQQATQVVLRVQIEAETFLFTFRPK